MLVAQLRKEILSTIDELLPSMIEMNGPDMEKKMAIITAKVKKAKRAKLDVYSEHLTIIKLKIEENLPRMRELKVQINGHQAGIVELDVYKQKMEALQARQKVIDAEQREINREIAIIELQMAPAERFA